MKKSLANTLVETIGPLTENKVIDSWVRMVKNKIITLLIGHERRIKIKSSGVATGYFLPKENKDFPIIKEKIEQNLMTHLVGLSVASFGSILSAFSGNPIIIAFLFTTFAESNLVLLQIHHLNRIRKIGLIVKNVWLES